MKAIVRYRYGTPDVMSLEEVEKPAPKDDEVLVKVHAVSLNRSDWEGLVGKPLYARLGGLFKPGYPILGSDIAGRVEAVGRNVTHFQAGDEVFGELSGYQGGFAEYACAREKRIVRKPASMTFEEAASIPQAAGIALQGIRDQGQVQPGQKVLINGAGGGSGTFAVQLAKLAGAEVTGVDNTGKVNYIRSLGADHVIDYTREEFTKSGKKYDLVLDLIAYRSVFAYQRVLNNGGTYFLVGGSVGTMFQVLLLGSRIGKAEGKKIRLLIVQPNTKDYLDMVELFEARKVNIIIDQKFSLSEVPEALRYLGEGRAKGKVAITIV